MGWLPVPPTGRRMDIRRWWLAGMDKANRTLSASRTGEGGPLLWHVAFSGVEFDQRRVGVSIVI